MNDGEMLDGAVPSWISKEVSDALTSAIYCTYSTRQRSVV